MTSFLALLLPVVAQADAWTPITAPTLCAERAALDAAPVFPGASHLRDRASPSLADRERPAPRLPLALVIQMMEEDARARGKKLEVFHGAPEILVRGDADAVAGAHAFVADVERRSAVLAIELDVSLAAPPAAANGAAKPAPTRLQKRILSGESASFGRRNTKSYVASFDVEVAADSGVAQPVIGSALSGRTVHVRATRVDAGRRVHITGVLDLAELVGIESFDPKTNDLGVFQQPIVHSAQVSFAGVVDSGAALDVTISDPALAPGEWTLSVRATTRPDIAPKDGDTQGWVLLDLSLLGAEPERVPAFGPGFGLDDEAGLREFTGAHTTLPASALAVALESARASGSAQRGSSRTPLYWTNDLLFVPQSDPAVCREAQALVRGAEAPRTRCGRMEVRAGARVARVPTCEGTPSRLWIGDERPWLVDYRADLAPQSWMPSPEVATTFDGIAVSIFAQSNVAQCTFWASSSQPAVELERDKAQLGCLQALTRAVQSGSARVAAGEPEVRVLELDLGLDANGAQAAGLVLRYQSP